MNTLVWVIDDDSGILEVTQIVLEEAGFEVTLIDSANALKDELSRNKLPSVILLDIRIGGTDGREVGKQLKADPKTSHIPIILMSADADITEKAREAKADTFLKKPFDISVLESTVKKYTQ